MGLKWLHFPTRLLLLGYEAHDLYEMVQSANPNQSYVDPFPIIFKAHAHILFISNMKILVFIELSYKSPQLYWLSSL